MKGKGPMNPAHGGSNDDTDRQARTFGLAVGLRHTHAMRVGDHMTVPRIFPEAAVFQAMPPVFATASMIGLMELACVEALAPFMDDEHGTVGTHVDASHLAATPAGATVTASVELKEIDGRRLWFDVAAYDGPRLIGEGRHQRTIVNLARFSRAIARKPPPEADT